MAEELKQPQSDSRAAAGRVHPLVVLWRMIFGPRIPKPRGPCKYCGIETTDFNPFAEMMGMDKEFRHGYCMRQEIERRDKEREERKKIDLIKTAIRELEAEKHNAPHQPRALET